MKKTTKSVTGASWTIMWLDFEGRPVTRTGFPANGLAS